MPFVETRLISPTTLTTSASSALYTVPTGYSAIIKQLVVTNITGTAATFTFYIGAASAGNALFSGTSVAANDTVIINLSQVLTTGEVLRALASAGSALNLTVSGVINDGPLASTATYIADNAITSAKIADGAIVNADINASAAIDQSKISSLTSDLALKAPLASPTLTGTPLAPTATTGTNTTQLATTAFANAAGGLVYITSVAATGASTTISNCFSSTYENYRVIFSNGATSNTSVYFYLQWTIAGTPSTVNMSWSYTGLNENGTTYSDYAGNGSVNSLAKLLPQPGYAGAVNNFSMDVYMPFLTARTFAMFQGTTYPSGFTFTSGGTAQDQQTSKDGFKLGVSAGTFTGTITVYGYRKA